MHSLPMPQSESSPDRPRARWSLPRTAVALPLLALAAVALAAPAGAASFQPIGDLPGGPYLSKVQGMSADGSVVVGHSFSADQQNEAFVWTPEGGIQGLGSIADTGRSTGLSTANGVTPDSGTVVGQTDATNHDILGFTWTQSGGMQSLPAFGDPPRTAEANAISDDGSLVVGSSYGAGETAVLLDSSGLLDLGLLDSAELGLSQRSTATGVSGDGSLVVGYNVYRSGSIGVQRAFTWTESGGMQPLVDAGSPDVLPRIPRYVSPDGSLIVGCADGSGAKEEAFVWTEEEGLVTLGDLAGGEHSAHALSATPDGSIVVGSSDTDRGDTAFI